MANLLSNLVDNLADRIHKIKYGHDNKKCEMCEIKYKDCGCYLQYTNIKVDLIEYTCLCCNKNYQKKIDKNLKKQFANIYKFSNHDINTFIFFLQKVVYS